MLLAVIIVLALVLIPIGLLILRFRQGDAMEEGGSIGRQYFGRKKDDWGPKSDPR